MAVWSSQGNQDLAWTKPSPSKISKGTLLRLIKIFTALSCLVLLGKWLLGEDGKADLVALHPSLEKLPLPGDPYTPSRADIFAQGFADYEYGGAFDGEELERRCSSVTWRTDVILQLHGANGGFGNLRAEILDFMTVALEYGTPITMPTFIKRNQANLVDYQNPSFGYAEIEHIFDRQWFLEKMTAHCPGMLIYNSTGVSPATKILINKFGPPPANPYGLKTTIPAARRAFFDDWLKQQPDYDNTAVQVVQTVWTYFSTSLYPRPRFAKMMGSLLRIRPDARKLAGKVVFNMRAHKSSPNTNINPHDMIHKNLFLGVHMRTDPDALAVGWMARYGGYDVQSTRFVEVAQQQKMNTLYLACGWEKDRLAFVNKTNELGMTTFTKRDLLHGADLEELNAMAWDQQALIDYEVLSRSSYFVGTAFSSFAFNLAVRRHTYATNDPRRLENPFQPMEDDKTGKILYDDALSQIMFNPGVWDEHDLERFVFDGRMFP